MTQSTNRLVDFINHGILPLAGRQDELRTLVTFWRNALVAQELRIMLLTGETGLGKSRLLDEAVPAIEGAGGTVVRARLIPESGTSIVPLVAQALWYDERSRRLLNCEPSGSAGTVAAWLRRLARLRPTVLMLEDLHLLGADGVPELASLLDAIAEETLAVVCSARPVELHARGLLERYLADEMELSGLEHGAVEALWLELFGTTAPTGVAEAFIGATGGNPLAMRTALRSAIKSGALHHDSLTDTWRPGTTLEAFAQAMRRSTDLLAEGMTAGLTDDERHDAETLAAIGEVFAVETARALLPDADRAINALMFKGILVTATAAPPPLPGRAGEYPLMAFTHSLLHQHLASASRPLSDQTITAIADGTPLYSTHPFQRLGTHQQAGALEPDTLGRLLGRALLVARHLDRGPTWTEAIEIWTACDAFVRLTADSWAPGELRLTRARLMTSRLSLMRRYIDTPEYAGLVREALRLTEGPIMSEADAEAQLGLLRWVYTHAAGSHYPGSHDVLRRIEEFVAAHPGLRRTRPYLLILRSAAEMAARIPDVAMLRHLEETVDAMLAEEDLPAELRLIALQEVAPQFLILFNNEEEFTRRQRLLETILEEADRSDDQLFVRRLTFLVSTGQMAAALRASEDGIERSRRQGLARTAFQCTLTRLCALGALGHDLSRIEQEAWDLCRTARDAGVGQDTRYCAIYLGEVGLLRNEPDWTRAMLRRFGSGDEDRWPPEAILLALTGGSLPSAFADLNADEASHHDTITAETVLLRLAAAIATGGREHERNASAGLESIFAMPILRTDDVLVQTAALALADVAGMHRGKTRDLFNIGLARSLEWLWERGLGGYLSALVGRFGHLLGKRDLTFWRARAGELMQQHAGHAPITTGHGYRVTMIGTMATTMPDGDVRPIRGARLKTMLGLLVASRMIAKPLTNNEFCRLAAGGELELDLARKTMNMAAVRLREAMGPDLIITGEETHELNLEIATVDLLEADGQLRRAAAALRRRALMLAYPAVIRALRITRGEVAFPGLYDDFFEAIREDFENRMRTTAIDVARALLSEDDFESAAELLREAFEWMPDDEEIAELLRSALEKAGSRADAQRVRMRNEQEA